MGFFSKIFKPEPFIHRIKDKKVVDKNYKYWRIRIFYSMYLGYALFYFTRYSFTFAKPALIEAGYDMVYLGWIASTFSIVYGVSKFISGILGDRSNPRYFMAIGLIATGVFNVFFGLSSSLWLFAVFWGLNSWFQGWGWPASAKLLTHWYSPSERGRWWSVWNTSHNLGAAIIPILVAYMISHFGWSYAMYCPGVIAIFYGFILINRLRDTPQSLGLPPIEEYKDDYPDSKHHEKEKERLSTKEILFKYVLSNVFIWMLSIAYFFVYIIRSAVNEWSQLYLVEAKSYTLVTAAACVLWFEIGGFFGSLVAGWTSDGFFKGKRNPVNVIFTFGVILGLMAMSMFTLKMPILDSLILFMIGFFIFGPQMLIGMAAAELSHKNAAGTATGFAGCFAYLGAAFAGGPLAGMIQKWGWDFFFTAMGASAIITLITLIPLWNVKTYKKRIL